MPKIEVSVFVFLKICNLEIIKKIRSNIIINKLVKCMNI